MEKTKKKNKYHIPFLYQVIFFPIIFILLLCTSIDVIYYNSRSYSYNAQDESSSNIKNSIDNVFKSVSVSIASFFNDVKFQNAALTYRDEKSNYTDVMDDLAFFLNSNAMYSPGIIYYPCDEDFSSIEQTNSLSIDVEPKLQKSNFERMKNSANLKLSNRAGTIFYQDVVFDESVEESSYFAIGKNVISTLSDSPTYYKRIGAVFVFFHKSLVQNIMSNAASVDGLDALITLDSKIIFSTAKFDENTIFSDNSYRHTTTPLSYNDWTLDTVFRKTQVLSNIGLTISLISGVFLLLLALYLFVIIISHNKYQKSLTYLFDSFSGIDSKKKSSLEISLTGDQEIDSVIGSYNIMMKNVVLLNEQIKEEQSKALNLKIDNINYSFNSLYSQINKHFIINVLSIIRSLINLGEKEKASYAIENFSNFLRYSLTIDNYSSLGEEIKNAQSYLNIQSIRYPNTKPVFRLDHSLDKVKIPKVILQPLLENCFVHSQKASDSEIVISTFKENIYAVIEIENDNDDNIDVSLIEKTNDKLNNLQETDIETVQNNDKHHHIALLNIAKRLKLDDPRSRIAIETTKDNKTVVRLYIPLESEE